MSKVSAKCTACGEIIEVDSSKEATICPKCGNPIVTQKAIENFNSVADGGLPAELSSLINNYNAFVKLYDVDYNAVLEPFRMGAARIRAQAELEQLVEEYNAAVKKADKMLNKANNRINAYNDAKFTEAVDSWVEKKASEWVDKGKKNYDAAVDAARDIERKIKAKKREITDLEKGMVDAERSLYNNGATLYYNGQALATAELMCAKFPSSPAGYLYKADFYMREAIWREKMFNEVVDRYYTDAEMLSVLRLGAAENQKKDRISAEIKKAETFMKSTQNKAFGSMLSALKKFVASDASFTETATEAPTTQKAPTSSSASKSTSPTGGAQKKTAKSETMEEKIARLQEEKRLEDEAMEQIRRKARRRVRLTKFIIWMVIIIGAGIAAYFGLRKYF